VHLTENKWECDVCGREIEFSARNKRLGLRVDERGILIQESPNGDVCPVCRPFLKEEFLGVAERVRRASLNIEPPEPPVAVPDNIPKYVFYFIGDGMGYAHVKAAENYFGISAPFGGFPAQGSATTYPADGQGWVTDSAASATALASGVKTLNYRVGLSPTGERLYGIAHKYREYGAKIGIATSVSVDHATPAGFYAGAEDRNMYYEIGRQIAGTGFDYFAGSGLLDPSRESPDAYALLANAGYAVLTSRDLSEISALPETRGLFLKQAAQFDQGSLEYAYNRQFTGDYGWVLEDFVRIGIERLYSANRNGFFFMVEGGKIDWAAHANQTLVAIHETGDFFKAVLPAIDFYRNHRDETLIVVTADHETGNTSLPDPDGWDIAWGSGDHSGQNVPVYAIGKNSGLFGGDMDNTDIPKRIMNGNSI